MNEVWRGSSFFYENPQLYEEKESEKGEQRKKERDGVRGMAEAGLKKMEKKDMPQYGGV